MSATRVVQWATGTTGSLALRAIIEAPDLDLIGVRVYDPTKVGMDAGELVGRTPTGVLATDDKEDILTLRADVVLYMGSVEKYPEECFADVVDLLALAPTYYDREFVRRHIRRRPGARPRNRIRVPEGDEYVSGRWAVSRILG